MALTLLTKTQSEIAAKDDARLYRAIFNNQDVYFGVTGDLFTVEQTRLVIKPSCFVVCGRVVKIDADYNLNVSTTTGNYYINLEISPNNATPVRFVQATSLSLTSTDINANEDGSYRTHFANVIVSNGAIVTTRRMIKRYDEIQSSSSITVDEELDEESTNPVQNATITAKIAELSEGLLNTGAKAFTAIKIDRENFLQALNNQAFGGLIGATAYATQRHFIPTESVDPNYKVGHLYEIIRTGDAHPYTYTTVDRTPDIASTLLDAKLDKSGGTMTGALDMAANLNLANNKYLNFYMSGQNFRYTFHADAGGKFYLHKLNDNGTTNRTPIRIQPNGDLELNHTTNDTVNNRVSVKSDGKLYINDVEVKAGGLDDSDVEAIAAIYLDPLSRRGLFIAKTEAEMRDIHRNTDIEGNPETCIYNVLYLGEDTADNAFKKYSVYTDEGDATMSGRTPNWVEVANLKSIAATKVDKVAGKGLSTNDFTNELKTKLENAAEAGHTHSVADITDLPQIVTYIDGEGESEGEWSNEGVQDTFIATTDYVDTKDYELTLDVASKRFCTHDNPDQLVAKFNKTATGLGNVIALIVEKKSLYLQYKQFICTSKTSSNFQFGHLYEISHNEETDEYTIGEIHPDLSLAEAASGGEGASITVDDTLSNTSTNPVQNKIVKAALDSKSDSSHTHSNYATSDHTHSGYATTTALSNMLPKSGGTMTGALDMDTNKNIKLKCGDKAYYYALHADSSGILYLHKMSSSNAVLDTVFKMYSTGVVEFHGVNVNDLQNRVTALETQLAGLETLLGNLL